MIDLLADLRHEFQRHKNMADRALAQLEDREFFLRPGDVVNPVALIVKHLAGNMISRWTDFRPMERNRAATAMANLS